MSSVLRGGGVGGEAMPVEVVYGLGPSFAKDFTVRNLTGPGKPPTLTRRNINYSKAPTKTADRTFLLGAQEKPLGQRRALFLLFQHVQKTDRELAFPSKGVARLGEGLKILYCHEGFALAYIISVYSMS